MLNTNAVNSRYISFLDFYMLYYVPLFVLFFIIIFFLIILKWIKNFHILSCILLMPVISIYRKKIAYFFQVKLYYVGIYITPVRSFSVKYRKRIAKGIMNALSRCSTRSAKPRKSFTRQSVIVERACSTNRQSLAVGFTNSRHPF